MMLPTPQICLRDYLASTILPKMDLDLSAPEMPPEGHKSHRNTLSTRPSAHRKLEIMQLIESSAFCSLVTEFMDLKIPNRPISAIGVNSISRAKITIPAEMFPVNPYDMTGFNVWFLLYPLKTVEAIIHFIYPGTEKFRPALRGFSDPENGANFPDDKLFRYIKWGIHNPQQPAAHINDGDSFLNVTVQPPWILSPQDLESFVNCREFPSFDAKGKNKPLDGRERLWAKIWDLSIETNCPWFVLSTYWGWVFGVFSKGRTRAWISSVIQYADSRPTVLECLVYWICSSVRITGGFKIPEVPEPVQCVAMPFSIPTPGNASNLSSVNPSQSWLSDSEEIECDSCDSSRTDATPIPTGVRPRPHPLFGPPGYMDRVHSWFAGQVDVTALFMSPPQEPSLSELDQRDSETSSTTSTINDHIDSNMFEGGWLTGNPEEAQAHIYVH